VKGKQLRAAKTRTLLLAAEAAQGPYLNSKNPHVEEKKEVLGCWKHRRHAYGCLAPKLTPP